MIGLGIATACMATVSAAGAARTWLIGRRLEKLHAPLPGAPPRDTPGLRWGTRGPVLAEIAIASLLDIGVALARIDPRILDAIDLAHGDRAFQSFAALQAHIAEVTARGDAAFAGLVSQYKGSLGELLAADHLTTVGHEVEFAAHPNQEGWDILVDGQPVQVKSGLDEGGIESALAEQSDVPVVTVREHAASAAGDDVTALPVSGSELTASTAESLEGIAGSGDLLPELPLVSGVMHGARNLRAYERGDISATQALGATAVGVAASTVGAAIGRVVIPIPIVGAALGALGARQLLSSAAEAGASSAREAVADRTRRASFQRDMEPVCEDLSRDLEAWRRAIIEAATAGATAAREAAARIPTGRRGRWATPSMADFIGEAARARFEQEAAVLDALALDFRGARETAALLEQWTARVPRMAGVAVRDARIRETLRRGRSVARRWKQAAVTPPASAEGPRPPLFVSGRPPWQGGDWAPLALSAVILGGATVALAALPMDAAPVETAGRRAAVPVVDVAAPADAASSPAERHVEVVVARCRVRAEPTTRSAIIGRERRGARCAVESQAGRWARVRCPSSAGFMHALCFREAPSEP